MLHNVAVISLYLPSGHKIGAGYQAHYMANTLVRRGHYVRMFSPSIKPDDAAYDHQRVDVGESLRTFRFAWNLRRVDWSRYDVIHAHGENYWLRTGGRPIHVRTMHGSCLAEALHVPRMKEKLRMFLLGITEMLAYAAADATVGVSQNTLRSYPWIKRCILNGVDTSVFCPAAEGGREKEPTILFVGTYRNRKRGKLLMDAFARSVLPAIPTAKLWMVCSDAPTAQNVEVLGRLSTAELADRYRRAWAFCLPSSYEGFGVPYIEAMASGTPVVATPNVGALEVLANGKYGVIAEPADLGNTLRDLLNDSVGRQRLAAVGLERSRIFSWDSVAAQYEALYAELMQPHARSTGALSTP